MLGARVQFDVESFFWVAAYVESGFFNPVLDRDMLKWDIPFLKCGKFGHFEAAGIPLISMHASK